MSALPPLPCDVALIGAGSVGTGVTALLAERGQRIVGVASRSSESAGRAAHRLSAPVFQMDAPVAADVYLIGAGAAAFDSIVSDLVAGADLTGRVVVHFSGAHGIAPLEPVALAGAHRCALHPVQACPNPEATIRNLPGSAWGVTTSSGAEQWATSFVELLGGHPVPVPETDRVAWHSAAVITSNGIAALLGAGERILAAAGVSDPGSVLAPLAAGTLSNARLGGGGAQTMTGPVVRAELDVIRLHAQALDAIEPELGHLYRAVSDLIARVAVASDRVEPSAVAALRDSLGRRS